MAQKKTLVIAGASGFIGRWFIKEFKDQYNIIALSRRNVKEQTDPNVEWRQVELYSLSSTEKALEGGDYALYLVHSMNPSTRLDQGSFDDTDLLLADNFARAAEKHQFEHLIFIGGILPKEDSQDFSRHLRSRYEVEQTLEARKTPVTTLRAGIIIGPGGSSFRIVRKLVENLPIMACPKWCEAKSQPIAVNDVLQILDHCYGNEDYFHRSIEIGGPEVLTYMDLLKMTARKMKRRRWIFSIPIYTVGFSKLWVARFTGSSRTLVSPLVESLKHTMTVDSDEILKKLPVQRKNMDQTIDDALTKADQIYALPAFEKDSPNQDEKNTVRSYQRLPNPRKLAAYRVGKLYQTWLPRFFRYIINARLEKESVHFHLLKFKQPILSLRFIADRSNTERQLFYITGGMLVKRKNYGWLEFREVLDGRYIIAAIHEFVPRLPWYVYVNTQAVVHLFVMRRFGRYLEKL